MPLEPLLISGVIKSSAVSGAFLSPEQALDQAVHKVMHYDKETVDNLLSAARDTIMAARAVAVREAAVPTLLPASVGYADAAVTGRLPESAEAAAAAPETFHTSSSPAVATAGSTASVSSSSPIFADDAVVSEASLGWWSAFDSLWTNISQSVTDALDYADANLACHTARHPSDASARKRGCGACCGGARDQQKEAKNFRHCGAEFPFPPGTFDRLPSAARPQSVTTA
mmetsp:Transcript_50755/g.120636  ORF Transcript_50755/g.120636 Transcript_50755/m.120636 type:complete len:228 (+) Transcript_50755:90-773(+)|eukprot:CAMPEP_0178420472 /NCGR_PEP_ID=MMETSP0689_2-20121128/26148_1 /TAXON_ID=160604 /ORGANISM="Amphidinium massartii, Strain CS-259" /LENGTH=227 /DNA_ID=CAMNT_0020041951 /DNA_START=51 /DNA_END=734 /DNA_ORIENTATION=-